MRYVAADTTSRLGISTSCCAYGLLSLFRLLRAFSLYAIEAPQIDFFSLSLAAPSMSSTSKNPTNKSREMNGMRGAKRAVVKIAVNEQKEYRPT